MAQNVAILDFGSGKITVLVGRRGINNTICMDGVGECDYAGFLDGEFLEPDQLSYVIGRAVSSAESNIGHPIDKLYIGVPGEFTTAVCRDVTISLSKKRVVSDLDITNLYNNGNIYERTPDFSERYEVINIQPIYFTLDDDRRLVQPVGLKSTKLSGLISYILAERSFTGFIDSIMSALPIREHEYVSSLLAETLFLFDETKRDQYVVLIDSGFSTTNVVVARGDGILQQFNIPMGGANITGAIAAGLGISFTNGEALKRKVVLSLDASPDDYYEINKSRDNAMTFPADVVNDLVLSQIYVLAETVKKALNMCTYDIPEYIPYHITGGGLSYIKGARDHLTTMLGKPVEIVSPSLPQFNRPHLSSSLGLLDMVLAAQMPEKKGVLAKLFGRR